MLVGRQARAKRQDIQLAVETAMVSSQHIRNFTTAHPPAQAMSKLAATSRPFAPPVHALVLPTQIPTDLLLTFRDLDEVLLVCIALDPLSHLVAEGLPKNDGQVPEHMNLIPAIDGLEQVR